MILHGDKEITFELWSHEILNPLTTSQTLLQKYMFWQEKMYLNKNMKEMLKTNIQICIIIFLKVPCFIADCEDFIIFILIHSDEIFEPWNVVLMFICTFYFFEKYWK